MNTQMLGLFPKGAEIGERKEKLFFLYPYWYSLPFYNEYIIIL